MMSSVWHKKRLSSTIFMNCFDLRFFQEFVLIL